MAYLAYLAYLAQYARCIGLFGCGIVCKVQRRLYLAIVCYLMSETLEWDWEASRQSGAYLPLFISQPSTTRYAPPRPPPPPTKIKTCKQTNQNM